MSTSRGGYTMLVVLLVIVVVTLIVFASLNLGGFARNEAVIERDEAVASSNAEQGLERTHAWLAALAEGGADLDQALDPLLDTTCALAPPLLTLAATADDHLPPFADGVAVVAGAAARSYLRVPTTTGGYLVRVDDNVDDALVGLVPSTGNNGCVEGAGLGAALDNPVRDRDRTVVVTVVGLAPQLDPAVARSRKALEVVLGPVKSAGIVTNGTVNMGGNANVCGSSASIQAGGSITGTGCLCSSSCSGGGPYSCAADSTCNATAAAGSCTAAGGTSPSTCTATAPPPATPPVNPWASSNAAPRCTGASCLPFYYLRWDGAAAQLFRWNYAGVPSSGAGSCANPQAWARVCGPFDNAASCDGAGCWQLNAASTGATPTQVFVDDSAALGTVPLVAPGVTTMVWEKVAPLGGGVGGCGGPDPYNYPPAGGGRAWDETPNARFALRADGSAGRLIPRGVWFIEGDVVLTVPPAACGALPGGWAVSLISVGSIEVGNSIKLKPAHPKGFILLSGRDLQMVTGNTDIFTCGVPAATLVHEQFRVGGNMRLESQLIVDARGACSAQVSGDAIQMSGTSQISVPWPPPIAAGRGVERLSWAQVPW